MELLGEAQIAALGEALAQRVVETFQLDLASLVFDCTNFDTFIDTENPSQLPQRGHAKSKRTNLRLVGLALLVSVDFHVPLFWKVYPGNQHDSVTFSQALQELTARYQALARDCQSITLVFDKGNNSVRNQEVLDHSGFHFVGSLVPAHFPDLLLLPREQFQPLNDPRLRPTPALRLTRRVWAGTHLGGDLQSGTPTQTDARHRATSGEKAPRLGRAASQITPQLETGAQGKGYTPASLTKQVQQICSGQYIAPILRVIVSKQRGHLKLLYRTDASAYARIREQQLGKRILFTDQHAWSAEQIVLAYRSQSQIEQAFAAMKDPHFLSWEPLFHWTDSKIRVHAFYCALALILGSLLQRRAAQNGLAMSLHTVLRSLSDIQEVTAIYPAAGRPGSRGRPRTQTTLTEMNPAQEALYRLFKLDRYRQA